MKRIRILGAAALIGLWFSDDANASSHREAPSMEPFGTIWLHVGGGVGFSRDTTFRDQDCNSSNSFFGCDFNAPGDFGDSGAIINVGVGTPLGGPFRGAVELFHGNNFQFEGPVVDTRGGDATIQVTDPFGSSSGTFPVDPVRADLAVDVIGARARFPLNRLFQDLLGRPPG